MSIKSKKELLEKFSSDPSRYYRVSLFDEKGFIRKRCKNCGRYFWTLRSDLDVCPNQPCSDYEFINNPPSDIRPNYTETWKLIEAFFVGEGHVSIKRYPVVARWRPDLYFTVASIIDFQRVEGGKILFDLPANPLIVPQMSLRFNDVENVGVTGRHYTSFCMIGQHAYNNEEGYWKDRTIELDYRLLTEVFKIPEEEVTFVEDVWLGYGAFGYSLEYFVKGLELGNAVFTEFEGTVESYRPFKPSVVDMGAGLERFVWLLHGTPTSYDPVFGRALDRLLKREGIERNEDVLGRYYPLAGRLDVEESPDPWAERRRLAKQVGLSLKDLERYVYPMEMAYTVLDHTRTLLFAITDGALPSNVGGGYNLRVILRRALDIIRKNGWKMGLEELMEWHAEELREMYPELYEGMDAVREIVEVESRKCEATRRRVYEIVRGLKGKKLDTEGMVKLYDSDGITPELLLQEGIIGSIPSDFYLRVTERHMVQKQPQEPMPVVDVSGLPPTRPLFYEDKYLFEFKAKVIKVVKDLVILDRTAFYARSGGQEPDTGYIGRGRVVDVIKIGDIIIHKVKGILPKEGEFVTCRVDEDKRLALMRHHTATHIINGAARRILGPWVWQHSAYKEEDRARLDITHHSHLDKDEIKKIEELANRMVMSDLPVELQVLPRSEAEKRFGFRIYQGGVVPAKELRIVNIRDFDVEACGGTHCTTTGEVGYIKILKTERVQDGVERIEFVAGMPAVKLARERDNIIGEAINRLGTTGERFLDSLNKTLDEFSGLRKKVKRIYKELGRLYLTSLDRWTLNVNRFKLLLVSNEILDQEAHIYLGDLLTNYDKTLVYVGIWPEKEAFRVLIFTGEEVQKVGGDASLLLKSIAKVLGGSGGGNKRLAQGMILKPEQDKLTEVATKYLTTIAQEV